MTHKTTIVHWFDFDRWEQRSYVNDPHGNKTKQQYQYLLGKLPPRYPLPAIKLGYHIDMDYVAMFNWTTRLTGKVWHKNLS